MNQQDIAHQIYETIRQSPNSDPEDIVLACSDLTEGCLSLGCP